MKYIGENAIKKLISLIKGDLATKQPTITASGLLKGDGAGTVTAADTQEATLVDVPNGLLKGDGTTISAAVAGTDYMAPPPGGTTGQVLKKTETGTEWADSNVFIATYGTTTSAEIEAAISSGKSVYAKEVGDDSYFTGVYIGQSPHGWFRFLAAKQSMVFDANFDNEQIYFKFEEWKCGNNGWSGKGGIEYAVNPKWHASTHASGGTDPITPADIGAATMTEVNSAIQTAIGNAIGGSY